VESGVYSSILRIDPAGERWRQRKLWNSKNQSFAGVPEKPGSFWLWIRNPTRIFLDERKLIPLQNIGQQSIEDRFNLIEPGKFLRLPIREGNGLMINPFWKFFRGLYPCQKMTTSLELTNH